MDTLARAFLALIRIDLASETDFARSAAGPPVACAKGRKPPLAARWKADQPANAIR
jgi:hypothetical protein